MYIYYTLLIYSTIYIYSRCFMIYNTSMLSANQQVEVNVCNVMQSTLHDHFELAASMTMDTMGPYNLRCRAAHQPRRR